MPTHPHTLNLNPPTLSTSNLLHLPHFTHTLSISTHPHTPSLNFNPPTLSTSNYLKPPAHSQSQTHLQSQPQLQPNPNLNLKPTQTLNPNLPTHLTSVSQTLLLSTSNLSENSQPQPQPSTRYFQPLTVCCLPTQNHSQPQPTRHLTTLFFFQRRPGACTRQSEGKRESESEKRGEK